MGIVDAFAKEDRVEVKFSDFYRMMKEVSKAELLMNAVNCDVPHMFIREMATGKKESIPPELDITELRIRDLPEVEFEAKAESED